jgi:hypothetical protein
MLASIRADLDLLLNLVMQALGRTAASPVPLSVPIGGIWDTTKTFADSPVALTAAHPLEPFDTTGGAITFLTPPAPFDGQVICLKPAVASNTPATLHANNGGGEVVEDPGNSGHYAVDVGVPGQGAACWWKYRAADTRWIGLVGV